LRLGKEDKAGDPPAGGTISLSPTSRFPRIEFVKGISATLILATILALFLALGPLHASSPEVSKSGASKVRCTHFASPKGSDASPGSSRRPYRTVQQLVDKLEPGQTGCLRRGRYRQGEVTIRTHDVRLTSYRGERAVLIGRLRVVAPRVTVDRLRLDGRNGRDLPSPTINADDVTFRHNDVSSRHSGVCFILGSLTEVRRPMIKDNRIHDCGVPATLYGHGIYMQNVDEAQIIGNTIYDNSDRGIKVGPDSQGALIRGNVIDGNPIGLNFSGNDTSASSGNVVEQNVIANSTRWWNVQTYWPGPVGSGNLVRRNCVHGGNQDSYYNRNGGVSDDPSFKAEGNLVAAPDYLNRGAKDFRLRQDSPCRRVVGSAPSG
jgi:Right handed beta helix region